LTAFLKSLFLSHVAKTGIQINTAKRNVLYFVFSIFLFGTLSLNADKQEFPQKNLEKK
jgi:hypothetical protein